MEHISGLEIRGGKGLFNDSTYYSSYTTSNAALHAVGGGNGHALSANNTAAVATIQSANTGGGNAIDCVVTSNVKDRGSAALDVTNTGTGWSGYFRSTLRAENLNTVGYGIHASSSDITILANSTNNVAGSFTGKGGIKVYASSNWKIAEFFQGSSSKAAINNNGDFWSSTGVYSFTGSHYTLGTSEPTIGDLLTITTTFTVDVNTSVPKCVVCTSSFDKKVYGVYNGMKATEFSIDLFGVFTDEDHLRFVNFVNDNVYDIYGANAVGEGMINVCAANGDIENGDYICSSNVPGKCMKQDDDLMHNYTVAKASEEVIWDDEIVGEGGCFEQNGVKCKMISCTYHCG